MAIVPLGDREKVKGAPLGDVHSSMEHDEGMNNYFVMFRLRSFMIPQIRIKTV